MQISLICSTFGRYHELDNLLKSLTLQTYKNFEVIIVDQNTEQLIDELIKFYSNDLHIIHIKSYRKGSTYNKNIGISKASGDILGFPDDDCNYYHDTLLNMIKGFNESSCDLIYGKIFNRDKGLNIMRAWPTQCFAINSLYQIMLYSSNIVIFLRRNLINYDSDFGINEKFGACEDIDLCYRAYKSNFLLHYNPSIEVNHPEVVSNFMSKEKSYKYGTGWGAFFAKHFDVRIIPLFIGILGYFILITLRDIILFRATARGRIYSLIGRINGFVDYLINYKFRRNNS